MSCIGSVTTTRGDDIQIKIVVSPSFYAVVPGDDDDNDSADRNRFEYKIKIINQSSSARVRLLGRQWLITDGNNDTQEVRGEGVVGEQPTIPPTGSFTYRSMVDIKTPVGFMQGAYRMANLENGEVFHALIGVFTLALDGARH